MSFGRVRKMLGMLGISALLSLAMPALGWAQTNGAVNGSFTGAFNGGANVSGLPCATFGVPCGQGCQTHHCPPHYKHCMEGPPRIHWTRGCPHPICNPCDLPHFGYFETCWSPWPFPPNWGHCPTVPPAALVNLNPFVNPNMPAPLPSRTTPGSPMPSGSEVEELNTLPRRQN